MSFLSGPDSELARQIAYALEDESFHPLDEVQDNAPENCRYFSDFECSLSEWSFAYGIAWATARTREPFAPVTKIAAFAQELAREAWRYHSSKERWQELLAKDRDDRGPVQGDPATQLEAFTRDLGGLHVRRAPSEPRSEPAPTPSRGERTPPA